MKYMESGATHAKQVMAEVIHQCHFQVIFLAASQARRGRRTCHRCLVVARCSVSCDSARRPLGFLKLLISCCPQFLAAPSSLFIICSYSFDSGIAITFSAVLINPTRRQFTKCFLKRHFQTHTCQPVAPCTACLCR